MKAGASYIAGIALIGLYSTSAQAETVTFGCDARKPDICYFSIRYGSGGLRNFTMKAGDRDKIGGVKPGKDLYIVSVNRPTPAKAGTCQRERWCKATLVKAGYNN